jgi:glucokinase
VGIAQLTRPVLALDLGGTQVRAAVILADGSRIARQATRTPIEQGPSAIIKTCIEMLGAALAAAPADVRPVICGIGMSTPGPIDPWSGVIVSPPNLGPDVRDIPIAADVESALGLPAYLDRDTNVAALGERAFGAARGVDDFLYVTVSTGIGGAIFSAGKLLHGPDGMAGELGHVSIELDGPRCGCGGHGHLEAISSGVALARDARAAVARNSSPFLAARAAERGSSQVGLDQLDARAVAEGEDAGDPACAALMLHARRAFALACAGFVNAFNPDLIVVGGTIAERQGDRLLGPARDEVRTAAFRVPGARVRIVSAELGADVSLAGCQPLVDGRLDDDRWRSGRARLEPTGGSIRP